MENGKLNVAQLYCCGHGDSSVFGNAPAARVEDTSGGAASIGARLRGSGTSHKAFSENFLGGTGGFFGGRHNKGGWIVAVLAESYKEPEGKHLHLQSILENDRGVRFASRRAMRAADHSCVRPESNDKNGYRPRNPEDSLLYRTIAGHLETFLAGRQERGREVPQFVEREMRAYLSCEVLACGFLRLQCRSCGKDRLLPLSCKGRSVCPSCFGNSDCGIGGLHPSSLRPVPPLAGRVVICVASVNSACPLLKPTKLRLCSASCRPPFSVPSENENNRAHFS